MGQKIHPVGYRLGISTSWRSKWYAEKGDYARFLQEDLRIREFLLKRLSKASVSRINIERPSKQLVITIYTAAPGVVIGAKGADIEKLRAEVSAMISVEPGQLKLNIAEVRKPEIDAKLVGDNIASQLERRVMFRRAMKRAVGNAMRLGAEGIKVAVAGRLNGADIARTEWYREGRVPLHTLRADIDYAECKAHTTYGVLGIKVWIYKGEVFDLQEHEAQAAKAAASKPPRNQGKR